jgi:hypothetical protein
LINVLGGGGGGLVPAALMGGMIYGPYCEGHRQYSYMQG